MGAKRLNSRQLRFAQLVAGGTMSNMDAFKGVYSWENMNANSLNVAVYAKVNHEGIRAEIERIQGEANDKAVVSAESLILELEEARGLAKTELMPAAMVAATMGKAKLTGLDKITVEIKSSEELTPWSSIAAGVATAVDDGA